MIKVNVCYHDDCIFKVEVKGHADYDDFGKDIVCAAVSTMVTTVINNILTLDSNAIVYDANDGDVDITVKDDNVVANKLLNNMLIMLKELANTYPKNIKIGGLKL